MASETPRGVSSKLLTMKFMQRAAASGSSGSADNGSPASKKRRLETNFQGRIQGNIDQAAMRAALDEQEAKRRTALEQHASADTHWVLNSAIDISKLSKTIKRPLNVVYVGYGELDSGAEADGREETPQTGRTSVNSKRNKEIGEKAADDKRGSDGDSSGEEEDNDNTKARKSSLAAAGERSPSSSSRSRSKSRSRRGDDSKAKQFRDKRKKKEVHLNKITSISAGGSNSNDFKSRATCYNCQETGHLASECHKGRSRGPGKT